MFSRLREDRRGAVMVVAVFMAVFMVGALWYIVGLADAMVYRERMQEGADAVAFSSAVVHARGMNIIAMMNLIMAAVLAVLVALKVAQLILAIIAAVAAVILAASFGTCGPCAAVISACAEGIAQIQNVINQIKQPIFNTLKALSTAQKGVAYVVPWLSEGEAYYLSSQYGKPVKLGLVASASMIPSSNPKTYGLPVDDGNYAKLCEKAGQDVGQFVFLPIELLLGGAAGPVEGFAGAVGNVIGSLCESVSSFFCEGGSTGSSAASNQTRDKLVQDQCNSQQNAFNAWKAGGPKQGFDPKYVILGNFDMPACKQDLTDQYDHQYGQNNVGNDSGVDSDVQARTPKKVSDGVQNGDSHFQVYSFLLGDTSGLHYAPKLVSIAGWGKRDVKDPGASIQIAAADAEFFYDCSGSWTDSACDGDEEAMWNMRWRARLRPLKVPGGNAISGLMTGLVPSWLSGGGVGGGPSSMPSAGDLGGLVDGWSSGTDPSQFQSMFQSWLTQAAADDASRPGGPSADPGLVGKLQSIPSVLSH
jgi:hypothetical protein